MRPLKITRVSYNSSGWLKPTGDARRYELPGTYNHEFGFGHEDWLFRKDWLIDGWRYAFIQGVNKSHARLVKESAPFDLTLYTIEPDKKRRYVATIESVECLDEDQADGALTEFRKRGWYDTMLQEIRDVGGKESALGDSEYAKLIFNVRFRMDNVVLFSPGTYAASDDPILKLPRYILSDEASIGRAADSSVKEGRGGSSDLPAPISYQRRAIAAVTCTPEHVRMQSNLMQELRAEFPDALVIREQNFVDVSVRTENELFLFEIKSDLEPGAVIRQALGQILEYGFHPTRHHELPVQLVIVGRNRPSTDDSNYLERLRKDFRIPISYRVVSV
jgi:hypothetical protein